MIAARLLFLALASLLPLLFVTASLAEECGPPTSAAARKGLLASMAGFAAASGTTGGLHHPLFVFDLLDDSAPPESPRPGTLRAAVEAARGAGGGWVTPGTGVPSGATIVLGAPLRLPANITLDGGCQGLRILAPPTGAAVQAIGTSNVVVTRWAFSVPANNVESTRPGDCLGFGGGADRAWVAFNSFGRCGDGALDITQSVTLPTPTRVTVAFNRFSDHDKVMLIATLDCGQRVRPPGVVCPAPLLPHWSWSSGIQVTLQRNLFERTGQRHPRVSGQVYVHMLDNLVAYRPFPRGNGRFGPGYGVLVGGGGRLLLDHGVFQPYETDKGWAAKAREQRDVAVDEGPGALAIRGARAPAGVTMVQNAPELVPEPPYSLRGGWSADPADSGLVEAFRHCVGQEANAPRCGHAALSPPH